MYCAQCGAELVEDANFCAQCGTVVQEDAADEGSRIDQTTASIDPGEMDPTSTLEDVPALSPGTGMFVVVRGPNAGARYLLDRETIVVGRHPDCEIFLHDVTVSRRHCEIRRDDDVFSLQDLGSLNGTYVNGERVEARALRSGDEVQIGRFKLLYLAAGDSVTSGETA